MGILCVGGYYSAYHRRLPIEACGLALTIGRPYRRSRWRQHSSEEVDVCCVVCPPLGSRLCRTFFFLCMIQHTCTQCQLWAWTLRIVPVWVFCILQVPTMCFWPVSNALIPGGIVAVETIGIECSWIFKRFTHHLHFWGTSKCQDYVRLLDTDNWHVVLSPKASFSFLFLKFHTMNRTTFIIDKKTKHSIYLKI